MLAFQRQVIAPVFKMYCLEGPGLVGHIQDHMGHIHHLLRLTNRVEDRITHCSHTTYIPDILFYFLILVSAVFHAFCISRAVRAYSEFALVALLCASSWAIFALAAST